MGGGWQEKKIWEGTKSEQGGSFILEGQAGGISGTAYEEAIPETAKLAGRGNSQVL